MSINKVILLGNVGGDIEIKTFDNGGKIGNFSLATSETYKNKAGEKVTDTEWHRCVIRNPSQVDIMAKYVSKGDKISVEGKNKTRSYEDKDGKKSFITEVIIHSFTFEGSKGSSETKNTTSENTANSSSEPDDLPF